MTAAEVMVLARSGELSQLSPSIKDDDATIIGAMNLGILEIYKRFPIKTDEALLTLRELKSVYSLAGTDADVSMGAPFLYLISAYGEAKDPIYGLGSTSLPINSEDNIYSVNMISPTQVQVPLVTEGAFISLIYASQPTKVTAGTLAVVIDLPDQFVEALLHYIGYRAHGAMDGNLQTESNSHYVRFEASCNKLKELGVGISPDDIDMNSRIHMRCFV